MTVTITGMAILQVPCTPGPSPVLSVTHFESLSFLSEPLNVGSQVTQGRFTRPRLLLRASRPPCSGSQVALVLPNGLLHLGQGSSYLARVRA